MSLQRRFSSYTPPSRNLLRQLLHNTSFIITILIQRTFNQIFHISILPTRQPHTWNWEHSRSRRLKVWYTFIGKIPTTAVYDERWQNVSEWDKTKGINHEAYASANVRMLLLILVSCTVSPTLVEDQSTGIVVDAERGDGGIRPRVVGRGLYSSTGGIEFRCVAWLLLASYEARTWVAGCCCCCVCWLAVYMRSESGVWPKLKSTWLNMSASSVGGRDKEWFGVGRYWTIWWHIEQRSLGPGNVWETITLFEISHVRAISSRRYPGHWCKLRLKLSSFGDLIWRSRGLDGDNRDQFRRSSKHCPTVVRLWFFVPRSSHHTSRRGFWLGLKFFLLFDTASFAETYDVFSSCSTVPTGRPSLSYKSNSRSGESSVDIQYLHKLR